MGIYFVSSTGADLDCIVGILDSSDAFGVNGLLAGLVVLAAKASGLAMESCFTLFSSTGAFGFDGVIGILDSYSCFCPNGFDIGLNGLIGG